MILIILKEKKSYNLEGDKYGGNLIYGEFPQDEDIIRVGIDKIDISDIEYANRNSRKIK